MKKRLSLAAIAGAVLALCGMTEAGAEETMGTLTCTYLRCEYRVDPLGIDVAQPRLSWIVESPRRGAKQTAYQVRVASSEDALAAGKADLWDSGKVESDQTAQVVYDGAPLASRTRCVWSVRAWDRDGNPSEWSKPALWTMGLLSADDWSAAWIGHDTRDQNEDPELMLPPSPYLRKAFAADKQVRRATVYASALGIYQLSLNGHRVSEDYFAPGWTDYNKRVYYQTYDVTELVNKGDNVVGGVLSNGWYAGYVGFGLLQNRGNAGRAFYGEVPALRVQLEVEYEDGSTSVIATDDSWKAGLGAVRGSDLQMGETYDARQAVPGWDTAAFDAGAWTPATVMKSPAALVEAYPGVPVRATEEIRPVEITSPNDGVYIFNMGQNFAGCVRLKVKADEGTRITLRFGEMLHGDGTLMTENLRKARAIDAYTCKGGGVEIWQPTFTYHGFQYVEVTGYPGKPNLDAVTGVVLGSDTPLAGSFECSSDMVNRLYSNITWTQRANFVEVPTDCPQRDERLGWTGDAQIYVRSATYNRDVAAFYTKWLVDLEDAVRPYGAYPDFAPLPYLQCEPSPAWMDAGIICPYTVYKVYGDTRVIERHYDAMARFVDYLTETSKDSLRSPVHHMWGDWLSVGDTASNDYVASCYYAYDAKLMAEMAAAIGRADDADKYTTLFTDIRNAIVAKYVTPEGTLTEDFQTAYALALYMDLLPEDVRPTAAARLVELIRANDWHLATGFLGVKHALPVLSRFGYDDVAYRLLTKTTYPSWGYSVVNGATSIWERWNSYTKENGIHDPGMNSFSHYAFGSVCEWMFASMAGIDTDGPGFKRIRIAPNPGGHGITSARASYDSIHGRIASAWRIENGRFYLDVTVPANTTAQVVVPAASAEVVTESGKPAAEAEGVVVTDEQDGKVTLEVGAGTYRFEAPEPGVAGKGHADDINGDPECTVACYYFPNYHPDARNAKMHGEGWAEWELVKAAKPRFEGHHQPNVPLWGYTDESDPDVMAQKIDAAADHGIDAFIFDWYWYDDGPFLQRGLDEGFLGAPNNNRMKFALMWANHHWLDIHPYARGSERKTLFPGTVTPETFDSMTDRIIEMYFKHPSYWTLDGRPYFSIYELHTLVKSFGSVDATRAALDRFREKVVAAGFPGLHLNAVMFGVRILPGETVVSNPQELVDYLNLDSITSYVWIHHVPLPEFPQTPYKYVMDEYIKHRDTTVRSFNVPYHPNVTMGWDASPRCRQSDEFVNEGYPFMGAISENTPEAFKGALVEMKQFLETQPAKDRIFTINCWNEWTEGSYLEPDTVHGMAYLEAVKDVFGE